VNPDASRRQHPMQSREKQKLVFADGLRSSVTLAILT
jgi:hypothetical protein